MHKHRRDVAAALGLPVEQTFTDPADWSDNDLQRVEPDAETRPQAIREARRTLRRSIGRGHRRRPTSDLRRTLRARPAVRRAASIGLRVPAARPRAPRPRRTRSTQPAAADDPGPGRPPTTRPRGLWAAA